MNTASPSVATHGLSKIETRWGTFTDPAATAAEMWLRHRGTKGNFTITRREFACKHSKTPHENAGWMKCTSRTLAPSIIWCIAHTGEP